MQTTENGERQLPPETPGPQSQLSLNVPLTKDDESDDPEQIFMRAVAEIDTQPLGKKKRQYSIVYFLQDAFCLLMILLGVAGIIWQCITYPHTLVILYTKAKPATITTTLPIETRTLAPVTVTRSLAAPSTGTGHQDARAASGSLTFYNGQLQSITVLSGSVFTGREGERVETTQDIVIPAADSSTTPPTYGHATVYAQAVHPGASGNIAAFDINGSCCAPSVIVKNLAAFSNGQDARTFRAVAAKDLQTLTTTLNAIVTRAFTAAFPVQPGEAALSTTCTTKATPDHQTGEEAQTVTLTLAKTCSAVAYSQSQFSRAATQAFMQTRPAKNYHLVGSVQTSVKSGAPLTVDLRGEWAYTFSLAYKQLLAESIAGDRPEQARAYLLKTGVISYASVPNTLASAEYIDFLVLVG